VTTTDAHVIGGSTAAERNVISSNNGHGIILGGSYHQVRGNFIGLDASGALPVGNLFDGVNVAGVFVSGWVTSDHTDISLSFAPFLLLILYQVSRSHHLKRFNCG
jgi:hypothetical protein